MSGPRYGFAKYACALCVTLASCSDSLSEVATVDQQPSSDAVDLLFFSNNTGAELDPISPPPLANEPQVLVPGPEGDSSLNVDNTDYPLNAALGDIWGVEGAHYNVDFTLTDGKFLVQPTEIAGIVHSLLVPTGATAIVYAELFSPGDSLMFVTYSYSAADAIAGPLAGNAYFDRAYIGVDTNTSGDVEDDEKIAVIGGTIDFTGSLPNVELRFSVTLENGQLVTGHYTGLFDFTDRR